MLYRKIIEQIKDFYDNNKNKVLMIAGARQIGKTYIIEKYAEANYKYFIKIDFIENPEYKDLFKSTKNSDDIMLRLSAVFGDKLFPDETLIFFEEVQECEELITQIKYLAMNNDYSFILSGSLLGTAVGKIRSVPVGYMKIIRMYPLDFEEFAIANGISQRVIDALHTCFEKGLPVDEFIHKRMLELFELYLIVGGMPDAVQKYIDTKNLRLVFETQQTIIQGYRIDVSKYEGNPQMRIHIMEIFDILPAELNSKNKRFIMKEMNETKRLKHYIPAFEWLKYAGVSLPTYNIDEPVVPLLKSKSSSLFKLFCSDCGLLCASYGNSIQIDILNKEQNINFGSMYENVAAQELTAHGFKLYYYNNKKKGELDFIIEQDGNPIPIEIKSGKSYKRHSALSNILDCREYSFEKAYIFSNANTEVEGKKIYLPIYMLMFIQNEEKKEDLFFETDFSDVNAYC